jgi:Predicted membrane protein
LIAVWEKRLNMGYVILAVYLLGINLVSFFLMGIDKSKARRRKWRIPEKTLFAFALLGGSIGSILGMRIFHHKTRHWYFVWGMPCILLAQLALAGVLYQYIVSPVA